MNTCSSIDNSQISKKNVMNNKKEYISPTLNVDTFQVEKGFVISTRIHMFNNIFTDSDYDNNSTERWAWDETNSEQNHFGGDEYGWD